MDAQKKPEKAKGAGLKPAHYAIIGVIIIAVIVIAAYLAIGSSAANVVAVGDNVSVYYTGKFTNGTVFDSNVGGTPLNFTVGANEMIQGFDQGVIGMSLNQTKNITVTPEDGYGEVNQSLIVQVPRSDFGNTSLSIGGEVSSTAGQSATITAFTNNTVTLNFNPPLAGKTLLFQIRVISIKR